MPQGGWEPGGYTQTGSLEIHSLDGHEMNQSSLIAGIQDKAYQINGLQ
jgi:hypothetical protein